MSDTTVRLSEAEIVRAREARYSGTNDLLTEQALAWCLTKHPHSLHMVHWACAWCSIERRALEAVNCAARCADLGWWNELLAVQHEDLAEAFGHGGTIVHQLVRIELPDGRWWYARVIDAEKLDLTGITIREGL